MNILEFKIAIESIILAHLRQFILQIGGLPVALRPIINK